VFVRRDADLQCGRIGRGVFRGFVVADLEEIVIRKIFVFVLAFAALQCALGTGAAAQSVGCYITETEWSGDCPAGAMIATGPGVFLVACTYLSPNCPKPGLLPENHTDCPFCSQPISLATGNTYIEQTDVRLPGISNGLTLTRRWNSLWPATQSASQVGLFGPNWRSTFEERVFTGADGYIKYSRGDGNFWSFASGSNGPVVAPANVTATLSSGASYWTVTFQNGEQRQFDNTSGSLIAIIDRNGNTTQLSYDGTHRLTTVTDPAGRHLYFGYTGGSSLVTSVTSDVGLTLTYAYDGQGRLSQITKPDLTTISFQYDANSNISAVLDSQGKVLESHTYDSSGRGLTASRANGVEAVTITYPQ
jgi:YD repeat-containing protein